MAVTFTIYITDEGIRATRETQQNPGWYIIPYEFRVSDTRREVNPQRTYASIDPNPWYSGLFSSLYTPDNENRIIQSVVIPPVLSTATTEKNYGEIYFIYKNHNDEEILFAIGAPDQELVYTPGISEKFYFSFALNNVDVKDTIIIQNVNPQDIEDHNMDPNAHPYKANITLNNLNDEGKARIAVKEYLIDETYKADDVVLAIASGEVKLFKSLVNNNTGNALTDITKWEEIYFTRPATTTTLGGVIIGEGIDVAPDGTISATKGANTDLSNLTAKGNSKFQYSAFSINNGTVNASGNNETLHVPEGSQTQVEEEFIPTPFTSSSDNGTMGGDKFGVTASQWWSQPSDNYAPWKALKSFDDLGSGSYLNSWVSVVLPVDFDIYNPEAIKITNIKIKNGSYASYSITAGSVLGTNDYSSTWTPIIDFTSPNTNAGADWDIDLSSNTNSYKYYRIHITNANSGYCGIWRMKLTATKVVSVSSSSSLVCDPCTITTADSRTTSFIGESVYDCSTLANGTYSVLKNFVTGTLSVSGTLTMKKTAPTSPSTNDLWLDISEYPLNLKVYDGSNWAVNNDLVYLGDVTVSSGNITTISNAQYNKLGFYVYYYSNGSSWYRIYSDNWCEQGGMITSGTSGSINYMLSYKKLDGVVTGNCTVNATTTGLTWTKNSGDTGYWKAYGYIN